MSVALPALLSCPAWSAKWEIVPTVSVEEMYTDNVSLSPDESKQDSWVTTVSPGISIAATGARLKFKAVYAPEVISYSRGNDDYRVFQRGNAVGTAELAKQLLFFDAGANVSQYDASLHGPITTSNANTTGNRATVATYYASPYLRRDFGSAMQAEARYTYSVVNSGSQTTPNSTQPDSTLSDSVANRINLHLNSGPAYKLLTWNVDFAGETIDYENGEYAATKVVTANARRLITPTIGLLAQVGYEDYQSQYNAVDLGLPSKGPSYSAGFEWTPSLRTRLAATAGHRFYGNAYSLDFSHRARLTTWGVGYSESVTSARSEFFVPATTSTAGYLDTLFSSQFPDPVARQKAVQDFIARTGLPPALADSVNFFNTQLFLVKRWQASAGILGVRNVLIANVFKESREALVGNVPVPGTGDFAASNTINQTGAGLLWNLRITAQNAWNMRAAYSRSEFPGTQQIDHFTVLEMRLSRQFEPRLSGSLSYRRQHGDSNVSATYTENAVIAAVLMRF